VEESIAVQNEIAREIASALQVEITPDEVGRISGLPTEDLEAYQLYLLGQQRFYARSSENLREAIQFFEAAIQKDSTFAEAWAGLAIAWNVVPWYDPIDSREAFARGREAAQQALELDTTLAEVHTALGGQALFDEWNWEKAAAHFARALEFNPNHAQAYHWISTTHRTLGFLDRAIEELEEGIRHNPLGNNFRYALANYLYDAGRIEEALAAYRKATTLEPPVAWGLLMMTVFLVQQGMAEEALNTIEQWGELIGFPDLDRLSVVIRAFDAPELRQEALEVLEHVKRETGLLERDISVASLNLHGPAEILRITRELIAKRDPGAISLGLPFTKASLLETPGVLAEFEAVGIPLH
jgi:tetratricopeptide (TPR) repeat protein